MMKLLTNILVLTLMTFAAKAQIPVPDSVGIHRDTIPPAPSEKIPVLSDTVQYNDTAIVKTPTGTDTVVKKRVHSPRTATLRSLMVPGLGQIYNRKYWKVPIVYGAIGFPMYLYFYNKKWHSRTKYALDIVVQEKYNDPVAMAAVHPDLRVLVDSRAQGSLVDYRNQFRKDMDYSILFTILMWGLNVVDATVDGHLKGFDVSEDLSLKIKPSMINGGMTPGVAFVINFK